AAIIGFGAVFLGPLYGLQAKKRQGAEGLVVAEAAHFVGGVAEKFIMAVPVFGVLMVLISNDVYKFSQTWVWLALALYAVALTTALRIHIPNLTRMNELMAQLVAMGPPPAVAVGPGAATAGPPPEVLELEARGKRAGMLS